MDSRLKKEVSMANEGLLELMISEAGAEAQPPFELAKALGPEFLRLDADARRRVAERPYALLTFRLHDAPWWQSVADGVEQSPRAWVSQVSRERTALIARRFLTVAWNASARGSLKSSVSLGISPAVTEILSRLTLEQLEEIAEVHTLALGPRWPDRVKVWRRLLEAARDGDSHSLDLVDRWAAQVSATELMRG